MAYHLDYHHTGEEGTIIDASAKIKWFHHNDDICDEASDGVMILSMMVSMMVMVSVSVLAFDMDSRDS